jgi:NitT/TauT family transport system permease protein
MASITKQNKIIVFFQGFSGILVFFLLWEFAPRFGWIDIEFFPPFSAVIRSLVEFTLSGELFLHGGVSLYRAGLGFAIASGIAVPLAFVIGWFPIIRNLLNPILQTFRQLPTLALFPVLMLLFGIGEVSKIAIIAKSCFWPIFLNTASAVIDVDPLLVKSAKSMCLRPFGMFRQIVLPSIFPSMFTGFRMSATTAILMLVAAEMMGANAGLGYIIYFAEEHTQIPLMYGAIFLFILLGLGTHYGLTYFEKKINCWKQALTT